MTIPEIIKSIADFGITIVLSGIVVYTIIKAINLFFSRWEDKRGNKKHDEAIDLRTEVGLKVQKTIKSFLVDHDGMRLEVIEFSNSVQSVAFLPFRYMTCTYEVFEFGRSPIGYKIDKISTSLFTNFFVYLQDHDYHLFEVHDKHDDIGYPISSLFEGSGTEQKVLSVIMKTPYDKAIGFISFKKLEITEDDIHDTIRLAEQLSGMLSINDTQSNMKMK